MIKQIIKYKPLSHQKKFHDSEKPKVFLSAGYAAGKSYCLVMKMLKLCSINSGLPGGLLAPTLKMAKRDVIPIIEQICHENHIDYGYNRSDSYFTFPHTGSKIYLFHGEDEGRSIRGPNLAFMCMNEVTLLSKPVYDAAIARVRLKDAKLRQVAMSGTPEAFSWHYDYFIETPREDTDLIYGDVRENKHISGDYVQMLYESYDELLAQQFIEGKFVNLTGHRAIYSFDRRTHLSDKAVFLDNAPIWVSMDFNVDPMSAVLWHPVDVVGRQNEVKRMLYAFDEISISDSNTYEFSRTLIQNLPADWRDRIVTIYPDPAGAARSTKVDFRSMPKSDIDILKQHGFSDIKYKRSIVSVRDCLNSLNNLFAKGMILINPKCKNFIADLERCTIKPGTNEIDKSDLRRGHWLDGAKNMADFEFPVVKSYSGLKQQRIR